MDYNINEDAIRKIAEPAVAAFEADVDALRVSHLGKPVPEVESALKAAARSHGLEPADNIGELAEDISLGTV